MHTLQKSSSCIWRVPYLYEYPSQKRKGIFTLLLKNWQIFLVYVEGTLPLMKFPLQNRITTVQYSTRSLYEGRRKEEWGGLGIHFQYFGSCLPPSPNSQNGPWSVLGPYPTHRVFQWFMALALSLLLTLHIWVVQWFMTLADSYGCLTVDGNI